MVIFMSVTVIDLATGQPLQGFRQIAFPAGEPHCSFDGAASGPVVVDLRGAAGDDLLAALVTADLFQRRGIDVALCCPYLPGARQDRDAPLTARVYAELLNQAGFCAVVAVDPHSDVMPALIDRFSAIKPAELVRNALNAADYVGVICPDAGAAKRTEGVAASLELPVFYARKRRDFATGKLSGFACETLPDQGRLLAVDDICDGGGTFLGLADATGLPPERLDLWVSHGVFSAGSMRLGERYGRIVTTDSHPGHPNVRATVLPLAGYLLNHLRNRLHSNKEAH